MPPTTIRRLRIAAASTLAAVAMGTTGAMSARAATAPPEDLYGPPRALRSSCEPVPFPVEGALHGAKGVSRLRYVVDASGRADAIEVSAPAGTTPAHQLLDAAAIAFLKGCRFDAQASTTGVPRQMDYVWNANDIGRDRWVMVRATEAQEPPDVYPTMVSQATCGMPDWPADVRAKVRADDVVLRLDVDAKGNVRKAAVLHSSGQPVIDDTVRAAAMHCEFQPARTRGEAVAATTQMLYPWADAKARLGFLRSQPPRFRTAEEEAFQLASEAIHKGCPDAGPPGGAGEGEGRATLRLHYDGAGKLVGSTMVSSSGFPPFDDATRKRFSSCGFRELFGSEAPIEDRLVTYAHYLPLEHVSCLKIEYPQEAADRNETGTVTLKVHFDAAGEPLPPTLLESSGHRLLDEAALKGFGACSRADLVHARFRADNAISYTFRLE